MSFDSSSTNYNSKMTFSSAVFVLLSICRCSGLGCGDFCESCSSISQKCYMCMDGYRLHNDKCEPCPDNCVLCSDDNSCWKCKTNFWGYETCDQQCPESCDKNRCDEYTGECHGCLPGFYGRSCSLNCARCKDGLCDRYDGQCTDGCIDGYYNSTSYSYNEIETCYKCSRDCALCQSLELCLECESGFFKFSFHPHHSDPIAVCYPCPSACGECNTKTNCTVCKPGKYGTLCQYNCSDSNCYRCNIVDGAEKCTHCETGYKLVGTSCILDINCSQNCVDGCDAHGLCVGGCKVGWSGQMCTKQCTNQCQKCQQDNDTICEACKGGFYTSSCKTPCNEHCIKLNNTETCRLMDGFCFNGCTDGYWGDTCDKLCFEGCNSTRCNQSNGFCTRCYRNYYGSTCQYTCSEHCADDGSILQICKKNDGRCEIGCTNGYSGEQNDKGRGKPDTEEPEIMFLLIGITAGICISLTFATGIRLFCYLRTKRTKHLINSRNGRHRNKTHQHSF